MLVVAISKERLSKKHTPEKYMTQCQWHSISSYTSSRKSPESSRALEARVAMFDMKTDNTGNETLFAYKKLKANNRSNPSLDRKGNSTRQGHADTWWSGPLKGDSQPSELRDSHLTPLCTVQIMVAHASVASSKPKVELDLHADTFVVGNNCLVVYDHNRPVNIYNYDKKNGHRSAKTLMPQ